MVMFILESFSADVIEKLGGIPGITPQLNAIIDSGLLFTEIYSPGYRTDQGLASLFNGFPAVPDFSITMEPGKYDDLDFFPRHLKDAGYHTSLYYGGDLEFADMKSYFLASGISDLNDRYAFSPNDMNAPWGVHDEALMKKLETAMDSVKEPFFSVILTLSSHEPFEVPGEAKFPGEDFPSRFKSCCYYTDECIGDYLQQVKTKDWYSSTLFIFVADHGHIYPQNRMVDEPARFHIPLLFYGEVLKPEFRGKEILNTGMQSDLAATLLAQVQLKGNFRWSNDLLNAWRRNFAYYSYDEGFGFIEPSASVKYDFNDGKTMMQGRPGDGTSALNNGKAFLQCLYEEYLGY